MGKAAKAVKGGGAPGLIASLAIPYALDYGLSQAESFDRENEGEPPTFMLLDDATKNRFYSAASDDEVFSLLGELRQKDVINMPPEEQAVLIDYLRQLRGAK